MGMMKVQLNIVRAKHYEIKERERERGAMKKDTDALRLETQNLRGHIKDAVVLEVQLNIVRAE